MVSIVETATQALLHGGTTAQLSTNWDGAMGYVAGDRPGLDCVPCAAASYHDRIVAAKDARHLHARRLAVLCRPFGLKTPASCRTRNLE